MGSPVPLRLTMLRRRGCLCGIILSVFAALLAYALHVRVWQVSGVYTGTILTDRSQAVVCLIVREVTAGDRGFIVYELDSSGALRYAGGSYAHKAETGALVLEFCDFGAVRSDLYCVRPTLTSLILSPTTGDRAVEDIPPVVLDRVLDPRKVSALFALERKDSARLSLKHEGATE